MRPLNEQILGIGVDEYRYYTWFEHPSYDQGITVLSAPSIEDDEDELIESQATISRLDIDSSPDWDNIVAEKDREKICRLIVNKPFQTIRIKSLSLDGEFKAYSDGHLIEVDVNGIPVNTDLSPNG